MKAARSKQMGRMVAIVALVLALIGCATGGARVEQFSKFAQAGVAFADSIPPVLEESFETTVATDSLVLLQARPNLSQSERLQAINESSESLKRRLAILQDLRRHANLMGVLRGASGARPERCREFRADRYCKRARGRARRAELAQLPQNEPVLAEDRQRLEQALQDVQDVRNVLGAVTELLRVVGRVVALMA